VGGKKITKKGKEIAWLGFPILEFFNMKTDATLKQCKREALWQSWAGEE